MANNAAGKQASATREAAAGQQMIEAQQLDMAKQQWQRYLDTYAPLENEYVDEARGAGSIANQNKAAGQVNAANAAAFNNARSQLAKSGVNPQSQKYLQQSGAIDLAEAASSATGQNDAREKVIARGDAKMTNALSLGKGMPASAMSGLGAASATGSGVMGQQIAAANSQYAHEANGIGQFGQALGGLTQSKAFQSWLGSGSGGAANGGGIGSGGGGITYSNVGADTNSAAYTPMFSGSGGIGD
jgi:hypothetical protein